MALLVGAHLLYSRGRERERSMWEVQATLLLCNYYTPAAPKCQKNEVGLDFWGFTQRFVFTDQASVWSFIRRDWRRDEQETEGSNAGESSLSTPHCCLWEIHSSSNLFLSFFSHLLLKIAAISIKPAAKLFFFSFLSRLVSMMRSSPLLSACVTITA